MRGEVGSQQLDSKMKDRAASLTHIHTFPNAHRRRERERERRLEARDAHPSKKSKLTRDRDRDVSEKVRGCFCVSCVCCLPYEMTHFMSTVTAVNVLMHLCLLPSKGMLNAS